MSTVFVPAVQEIDIKGEKVIVRDPALHKVLALLRDAKPVLTKLMGMSSNPGELVDNFTEFLADEDFYKGFCLCASACTNKPVEFFSSDTSGEGGISLSEAIALLTKMQTAVNWGVLKELFLKLIPSKTTPIQQ